MTERQPSNTLTLAELEAAASFRLTWLLTLNFAGVTGKESVVFQVFLIFGIDFHQCTGDSEAQSLALTCETASVKIGFDVIFLCHFEQCERLFYHILQDG